MVLQERNEKIYKEQLERLIKEKKIIRERYKKISGKNIKIF